MRRHLQHNAIAYLALFVALGGTSYAAVKLPRNSVGNRQIKANAVTSGKVKNRSLKAVDFARGQVPAGAQGAAGAKGDAGPAGPIGATGATGRAGPTAGSAQALLTGATAPTSTDGVYDYGQPLTLAQPSKVFLFMRANIGIGCSAGGQAKIALALADATQPTVVAVAAASGYLLPVGGAPVDATAFGVTESVPAGSYRTAIVYDCTAGIQTSGSESGSSAIGAIVLGG